MGGPQPFRTGEDGRLHSQHQFSSRGFCLYQRQRHLFRHIKKEEFSVIDLEGNHVAGPKPSKEFPLHLKLYQEKNAGAVIHTHSFYCALWSCLEHENPQDVIPQYTPYLKMKVGTIGLIPMPRPAAGSCFRPSGKR